MNNIYRYGVESDEDDDEQEQLRRGSQDTRDYPLLQGELSTQSSLQQFASVPSHGSFYTEFFPPDLSQFKTDRYRLEGAQPLCMTSAWRVISFFIVVFVLPTLLISIPLYARYHLYHAKVYALTDGDMRSFHYDVSSFWCQGQRVESNGTFDAYLTKEARRSKRKRVSELSSDLLLTHDDVEEWGIHLIQGSYFTFSSCARWPGGTLLVVQGEENMRRCFYKEERLEHELKDANRDTVVKVHQKRSNTREDVDENVGGEVFDDYDILTEHEMIRDYDALNQHEAIHQLHSDEPSYVNTQTDKLYEETSLSSNTLSKSKKNPHLSKDELFKLKKHTKGIIEKKQLRKYMNIKEESDGVSNQKQITKREANYDHSDFDVHKLESMLVDKGSFFFNLNDTLDVTTGNSSFSSSEEFLQQCSDTIVTIDLTPSPACSQRSSTAPDSPYRWKFRANETDYYYFIFTSDNSIEANVITFKIVLERRLYDVSDPISVCSNQSECVFPFSFMKSQGVIVDFPDRFNNVSTLEYLQNYQLTAICQPRSVVYTVFILLVPFIIVLFAFR